MDIRTLAVIFLNLLAVPVTFVIFVLLFLTTFLAIYPFYIFGTFFLTSEDVAWEEVVAAQVLALAGALLIVAPSLRELGFTWIEVWGYILGNLCWTGGWMMDVLCWMLANVLTCIFATVIYVMDCMVDREKREVETSKREALRTLRAEKKMGRNRSEIEIIEREIAAIERVDISEAAEMLKRERSNQQKRIAKGEEEHEIVFHWSFGQTKRDGTRDGGET